MDTAHNPLLQPSRLQHEAIAFDLIQSEHFVPALKAAIQDGKKQLESIKKRPATFENTLIGLELATQSVHHVSSVFQNLFSAHGTPDIQKLMPIMGPQHAEFNNDLMLDFELFKKVEQVYEQRHHQNLNQEQIFFVEKVYRDFAKSGAHLPQDKKIRLREIDQRLSQIIPQFRAHVTQSSNKFELWISDPREVPGLSPLLLEAAKVEATRKGRPSQWLFTLQMPSYIPFMKFCANRELRKQVATASGQRAFGDDFDNQSIILEEVALMTERAHILGFKTYAHMILDDRMAETPEQVGSFLERLLKASLPMAKQELTEVAKLAHKMDGIEKLEPYDVAYYSEKLKELQYKFDENSLRPYFKLENVVSGVFEHARRLYDLVFVPTQEYPTYHPEVEVFEVYKQSPQGEFMGLFYTDFFPRETKSQGAWMTNYRDPQLVKGQLSRPHVGIVCNFTRPTPHQPSLLTFDEVATLFHEFGHALHSLLSRVNIRSLAGTNVYWDFVELPSQIMENWLQEEQALQLFARHFQTGETIPQELIEKIHKSDLFMTGMATLRQVNFALLDMAWFTTPPTSISSVPDFEAQTMARSTLLPPLPGTNISTSFSHIFGGGYASGYYSYHWAEALDADAFECFKEHGIFNREIAQRFEQHILSKGGSDHPMHLFENFRGRKPDPDALLRSRGLQLKEQDGPFP